MKTKTMIIAGTMCWMVNLWSFNCQSQDSKLDVGFRMNKAIGLYLESGFSANYSHHNLFNDRLYFGASYFSSRLGSAMGSNAIKQDNYVVFTSWYFRETKKYRPFLRVNAGYFNSDYESEIFKDLDNSSGIFSFEAGYSRKFLTPLKWAISAGYNLSAGDGTNGSGTLYPIYLQSTLSWNIIAKR